MEFLAAEGVTATAIAVFNCILISNHFLVYSNGIWNRNHPYFAFCRRSGLHFVHKISHILSRWHGECWTTLFASGKNPKFIAALRVQYDLINLATSDTCDIRKVWRMTETKDVTPLKRKTIWVRARFYGYKSVLCMWTTEVSNNN